jgi:hypothetical protein
MRLYSLALVLGLLAGAPSRRPFPAISVPIGLGGLRPLASADAAQPWTGVGRLDTGISFCSATLISERLVLTAAHCLFTTPTRAPAFRTWRLPSRRAAQRSSRGLARRAPVLRAGGLPVRPVARPRRDRAGHGASGAGASGAVERDRAARHRAERRAGARYPSCPTAPNGRRMPPSRKAVSSWRAMAPCACCRAMSCRAVPAHR